MFKQIGIVMQGRHFFYIPFNAFNKEIPSKNYQRETLKCSQY